jgi:hypothetical protein
MSHVGCCDALEVEIAVVRELMLKAHYFQESQALSLALTDARLCQTPVAAEGLSRASSIARQFGYPEVARWATRALGAPHSETPNG